MDGQGVSVVIPHFFHARAGNLNRIAAAFAVGTVIPGEIIVWNNDRPFRETHSLVRVIQSYRNIGPKGRFLAALAARGNRVLFLDNDTAPRERTLENLLEWASVYPVDVLTLEGRLRGEPGKYKTWEKVYGRGLREPVEAAISLGRGELVPHYLVPRILARFPFDDAVEMDDLWFSACARAAGTTIRIVPARAGESDVADLPMCGVGMCRDEGFYARRDEALKEIEWRLG